MARNLTPAQRAAYAAIQENGKLRRGQGHRLTTVRRLAAEGLVTLTERTDAEGTVIWWWATLPAPAPAPAVEPAPVGETEPAPVPGARRVLRLAVTNPDTGTDTYTGVMHFADHTELVAALRDQGVPQRHVAHGTGGSYRHSTRRLVWRSLPEQVLREFVAGGEVYRLGTHPDYAGSFVVTPADGDEVLVADPDAGSAQMRAVADIAALNAALRAN